VASLRTTICCGVALFLLTPALSSAQAADAATATSPRIVALDPRWTVSLESVAVPPGFDQQLAYVPLKSGGLLAVDLDDGRVHWTSDLTTAATPATGDGLIFVAGDALVLALEQASGRTLWRTPLGAAVEGAVHWDSGMVLVSLVNGDLVALHSEDGRVVWRSSLGSPMRVSPSAIEDRLFVALRDGRIAALDARTGATIWNVPMAQDVTGVFALDDQLLVGTRANLLHSLTLDRGRIRWSQKAGADVIGAATADEDLIYFVAFDNVLRALNRRSGNIQWRRNLPSRPAGGPLRADDVVLVPLSTNDIAAFLARSGAPSFTIQAAGELGAPPFLRESARPTAPRLIAISREGALQGFAPRIEPAPVPLADLPGVKVGG
jgi:outer membrane protein assembly factor BamB